MSELSIKVMIGGRTYPLTINRNEEELVRLAAKNINESIKHLQENYAVKDMQDLLAMTCLQVATKKDKTGASPVDLSDVAQELKRLENKLDTILED